MSDDFPQKNAQGIHKAPFLRAVIRTFIDSKITPLLVLFSLLLGLFAIFFTPSEEEPQIVVPIVDIMVSMPGATPVEVETRVIDPMEKLVWEIPGVEYVYSTAMNGRAMTVVRFYVGEDRENSLVKVYDKLYAHLDWIPPGCSRPLLKPYSIDDVPIVCLTLFSDRYNSMQLRQVAARLDDKIRSIPGISSTFIKGGLKRQVRVRLRPDALAAVGLDAADIVRAISSQNQASWISEVAFDNKAFSLRLNNFFSSIDDVRQTIVAVSKGTPVRLGQVATLTDGAQEPESYVMIGAGPGMVRDQRSEVRDQKSEIRGQSGLTLGALKPAVTIAVAKRKGWNATELANKVKDKVEKLKGFIIPDGVHVVVTRDYGETAKDKSNELLEHLAIATISVAALMALLLGIRSSLIVLVAIPVTLAYTLFIYYLHGYTLNRVTLFALIFCIGILVDDPIVGIENIMRHLRLSINKDRPLRDIIVDAVVEVGSPLILATVTVIVALLPLAFVRGLMGPYMRPMPVGASVAMLFSMVISFVITPWTAYHVLRRTAHAQEKEGRLDHIYRWAMGHLVRNRTHRWLFLGFMGMLFLLAGSLIYFKVVKVKILPFDNKNEFQVIIDMPEGTALEQTARVAEGLGSVISKEPLVTNYELYIGTASPFNFNGLVRHYYLRRGSNVADIQVNLISKHNREEQSHSIARRLRPKLDALAKRYNARIKVAEIPPGPPVLETLVAEIYGPNYEQQIAVARKIRDIFEKTPSVVDVDWYMMAPQKEYEIEVDRDKAMADGIAPIRVMQVLHTAVHGTVAGLLHDPGAREDIPLFVRLPLRDRSSLASLKDIKVKGRGGNLVSLAELSTIRERVIDHPIYHKNLKPVVYVTGDMAGEDESPVYGILNIDRQLRKFRAPDGSRLKIYYTRQPFTQKYWSMKWDGEWQVTYEVFRDMGLAFAVVLVLMFVLVVGWFRSYSVPLVILSPIPLSLIGIIPAHALMGAFFTTTSMIGFIAGAGIVVRNSIILVDFIELRLSQKMPIEDAVIDAGTIRFRPMLLTSSAVVVGSFVILFDPIFQGLAISLMAGEIAATIFSRMVVPVLYYLDYKMKETGRLYL